MRFQEIISRITGLSTPIFGIAWHPPEPQIRTAHRVITFLEDRRVLFEPSSVEVPDHCVRSVIEIRHYLTTELQAIPNEAELSKSLRALRAACRKFITTAGGHTDTIRFGSTNGHYASWVFIGALGELRGVFGVHLARIATCHGLDVEEELASILPGEDG